MQISTSNNRAMTHMQRRPSAAASHQEAAPSDNVTLGSSKTAFRAMGFATGALGVGLPLAGVMGGIKIAMNSSSTLGTVGGVALSVTSGLLATGTIPMSLMGAAMSTDSGETSGANAYLLGAGLSTVGAGAAIFLS